jgi:arylsulfatase A-like enzyme
MSQPRLHMKLFITALAVAALCLSTAIAKPRPNIVFVFSDDHATQAIGTYGFELSRHAPPPNLDRIAEEGIRFDGTQVTFPKLLQQAGYQTSIIGKCI